MPVRSSDQARVPEKAVLKALWKFVFRLTDERCEKNRVINYSALGLLYGRNPAQFQGQIEADRDYFSSPVDRRLFMPWITRSRKVLDSTNSAARLVDASVSGGQRLVRFMASVHGRARAGLRAGGPAGRSPPVRS
jgi:hypothetical protein